MNSEVKSLIRKAEAATDATNALKFSQAACNAANALAILQNLEYGDKE